MGVSGLAATSICGFSPCCSQRAQAYFLRTCLQALKAARNIFNLPAFLGPDLLPLLSAARASALFRREFMHVGGDRKIFEVGNLAASGPLLDAPQFVLRLRVRRNILRMDRFLVQFLGKI